MAVAWTASVTAAPDTAPPGNTILVFGDSLSAAYGIDSGTGWVALLEKRLKQQGYEYRVVNASVSGETTGGGRIRLPQSLNSNKPKIVILELGANDALRGLPLNSMRNNLNEMIRAAQAEDAKILLIGMQMPPNYGEAYTKQFEAAYRELAQSSKLALVPFFLDRVALDASLMQADNLHPNERGQPQLLENIWPKLKPLLVKKTS